MARKRLVHGVGINDSDYPTSSSVNGKRVVCPYYASWVGMLMRCYSTPYQSKNPSYYGCSVCDEWLTFSSFKRWMERQDWKGMDLDKDIILEGNKVYGPKACAFVDRKTNCILLKSEGGGKYPTGVYLNQPSNKFVALCSAIDKKYIGSFDTPEEASAAYRRVKKLAIIESALLQSDNRVFKSMLNIAIKNYS